MTKRNDSYRYVVPNPDRGGWDVVKEGHKRASTHAPTKAEAISRGRGIVKGQGGGELRIASKQGKLIDSDTVREPRHTESPARDRK
jgi:hypothetical protein